MAEDLVVVSLPGVQRMIADARSTADLRSGSAIIARLAGVVSKVAVEQARLVIPHALGSTAPNRVVFIADGDGAAVAERAADAVRAEWDRLVERVFGERLPTPGFPVVQWVCVPAGPGYAAQWERAQALLIARRRVRAFDPVAEAGRDLCSLSPRWPASRPPSGLAEHEKAVLSAANWVKRRLPRLEDDMEGFPSTPSIASAPFRAAVAEKAGDPAIRSALTDLHGVATDLRVRGERAVAGLPASSDPVLRWWLRSAGPWVYRDAWEPTRVAQETGRSARDVEGLARRGGAALRRLSRLCGEPGNHYAVLVQDLDSMGRFLSGAGRNARGHILPVDERAHREVAQRLGEIADAQRVLLRGRALLASDVYLGGDDLLALVPAATALAAASGCRMEVPPDLPTASTAVLFVHRRSGLQGAVAGAQELLERAKHEVAGKNGIAVGFERRSGAAEVTVRSWGADPAAAIAPLQRFARDGRPRLSPRLLEDLRRGESELTSLRRRREVHAAELRRLVHRHLPPGAPREVSDELADALAQLERDECGTAGLLAPARVGVFLRQEAR